MGKLVKAFLLSWFCAGLVMYVTTAFVIWDFNPKNWDTGGRAFTVWLWFVLTIVGAVMSAEDTNHD